MKRSHPTISAGRADCPRKRPSQPPRLRQDRRRPGAAVRADCRRAGSGCRALPAVLARVLWPTIPRKSSGWPSVRRGAGLLRCVPSRSAGAGRRPSAARGGQEPGQVSHRPGRGNAGARSSAAEIADADCAADFGIGAALGPPPDRGGRPGASREGRRRPPDRTTSRPPGRRSSAATAADAGGRRVSPVKWLLTSITSVTRRRPVRTDRRA